MRGLTPCWIDRHSFMARITRVDTTATPEAAATEPTSAPSAWGVVVSPDTWSRTSDQPIIPPNNPLTMIAANERMRAKRGGTAESKLIGGVGHRRSG